MKMSNIIKTLKARNYTHEMMKIYLVRLYNTMQKNLLSYPANLQPKKRALMSDIELFVIAYNAGENATIITNWQSI